MVQSHSGQNSAPRNYEEKRNFRRMSMDCAMSFATSGECGTSPGYCKNLSAQGVLFSTLIPMQVGALVDIYIAPQKAVVKPFNAVVEVLRVSNTAGQNNYEVAARITQMK